MLPLTARTTGTQPILPWASGKPLPRPQTLPGRLGRRPPLPSLAGEYVAYSAGLPLLLPTAEPVPTSGAPPVPSALPAVPTGQKPGTPAWLPSPPGSSLRPSPSLLDSLTFFFIPISPPHEMSMHGNVHVLATTVANVPSTGLNERLRERVCERQPFYLASRIKVFSSRLRIRSRHSPKPSLVIP